MSRYRHSFIPTTWFSPKNLFDHWLTQIEHFSCFTARSDLCAMENVFLFANLLRNDLISLEQQLFWCSTLLCRFGCNHFFPKRDALFPTAHFSPLFSEKLLLFRMWQMHYVLNVAEQAKAVYLDWKVSALLLPRVYRNISDDWVALMHSHHASRRLTAHGGFLISGFSVFLSCLCDLNIIFLPRLSAAKMLFAWEARGRDIEIYVHEIWSNCRKRERAWSQPSSDSMTCLPEVLFLFAGKAKTLSFSSRADWETFRNRVKMFFTQNRHE